MTCTPRRKASTDLLYLNGKQRRRGAILHQCDSFILTPVLTKAKKGNNYLPIKEDETNGDRKKHLTYLGWKTK